METLLALLTYSRSTPLGTINLGHLPLIRRNLRIEYNEIMTETNVMSRGHDLRRTGSHLTYVRFDPALDSVLYSIPYLIPYCTRSRTVLDPVLNPVLNPVLYSTPF